MLNILAAEERFRQYTAAISSTVTASANAASKRRICSFYIFSAGAMRSKSTPASAAARSKSVRVKTSNT